MTTGSSDPAARNLFVNWPDANPGTVTALRPGLLLAREFPLPLVVLLPLCPVTEELKRTLAQLYREAGVDSGHVRPNRPQHQTGDT